MDAVIPSPRLDTDADREPVAAAKPDPRVERPIEGPVGETIVIEPRTGWRTVDVGELWRYRELLYFLTWRDVKVRYKQTVLGAAWAVLQPVMMMVVFSLFFGRVAQVSSGDFPYPVFVYAGLLPWTFFATAITNAGNSVVGSERLISKVYFPRLIVPFASVGAAMVDFAIAFGVLLILMLFYGLTPGAGVVLLPALVLLLVLSALGIGTLIAALNVKYRDFRYVIPFLLQLWMFATPTVYMQWDDRGTSASDASVAAAGDAETKPESSAGRPRPCARLSPTVRSLIGLNPMVGLISAFRAATLGGPIPWTQLGVCTVVVVAAFAIGCFYFRRLERTFSDIL